jgi:hypothetical protein
MCILHPRSLADYWNITKRFGAWFIGGVYMGDPPYTVRKVRSATIEAKATPRPPSWWHRIRARLEKVFIGRQLPTPDAPNQMITMVDGDRCGFTPMHVEVVPSAVRIRVPRRQSAETPVVHEDNLALTSSPP